MKSEEISVESMMETIPDKEPVMEETMEMNVVEVEPKKQECDASYPTLCISS